MVGEDDSEAILETLLTYAVSIMPHFCYCIFIFVLVRFFEVSYVPPSYIILAYKIVFFCFYYFI